jgi:ParB-like chromosome segregation protein Spo0J
MAERVAKRKKARKPKPAPAPPAAIETPAPDLDYIAEALRPLAIAVDQMRLDPRNARKHSDENLRAIEGSLRTFGQLKPVVVNQETGEIEAGNGTYLAARRLGWSHLAAVLVRHDPAAHRGFALADNRTAELAEWDDAMLAAALADVQQEIPELYEELLLADLVAADAITAGRGKGKKRTTPEAETWSVLIKCRTEAEQCELIDRLSTEGLDCRAL